MHWIAILVAAVVVLAGVLAIVAVLAAGASDRMREGADLAESALWASGFAEPDRHLLATLATVARTDLGAATVEIVLTPFGWAGNGVVVTGSRLAPNRIGARVTAGEGTVGRAIATRQTRVAGDRLGYRELAVPIAGPQGLTGVVVAVSVGPLREFGAADLHRLEALAARTGRQLSSPISSTA